eukprot:gnl/MRDRNA2_/MRDRNA2_67836_c0_seq1.p1 gnl/MRDRNA2_/MRDRNA2_67836_c0~~gnl/MRDRNA2_/MRDRNA2_67836_c0_seq1.p1  ORF type:complete len:176 (-),score=28.77 gnl/MRDRNA2_/MRDRNA2_67836_c0_seq1:141-668(-)
MLAIKRFSLRSPSAVISRATSCVQGYKFGTAVVPRRRWLGCPQAVAVGKASYATLGVQSLNTLTFHHRLEESKVALVCFTSLSCGVCRHWKSVLPLLQERANEKLKAGYDFELTVFEVDAGDNMGLVHELEIVDLPALFVYMNGEYHCPLQAPPETEALYMAVVRATRQPAQEEP